MPREIVCPRCGLLLPIDPFPGPLDPEAPPESHHTIETIIPGTHSDDEPDQNGRDKDGLARAAPPSSSGEGEPDVWLASSSSAQVPALVAPGSDPSLEAFVAADPILSELPHARPIAPEVPAGSGEPPILELEGLAPSLGVISDDEGTAGTEPAEPVGRPWGPIVLASYASALTIALLWLFLSGRIQRPKPPAIDSTPFDSRPDLGPEGRRSRALIELPRIPNDRLVGLGQVLKVGQVELSPLEVSAAPVTLIRVGEDGDQQRRETEPGTLTLRLRLRNTSERATFAPLDPAFIREPDRGFPESFIETSRGERIFIYPLAIESEWSIEGQDFEELKPGESAEYTIVSEEQALARKAPAMTWRLRLRTASDRTDVVGVRFSQDEIR
jgi:hypothetical protein